MIRISKIRHLSLATTRLTDDSKLQKIYSSETQIQAKKFNFPDIEDKHELRKFEGSTAVIATINVGGKKVNWKTFRI